MAVKRTRTESFLSLVVIIVATMGVSAMFKYIPVWILWTLAILTVILLCWILLEGFRRVRIQRRFNDEDSLITEFMSTKPRTPKP